MEVKRCLFYRARVHVSCKGAWGLTKMCNFPGGSVRRRERVVHLATGSRAVKLAYETVRHSRETTNVCGNTKYTQSNCVSRAHKHVTYKHTNT